jgi:hypothetical protein
MLPQGRGRPVWEERLVRSRSQGVQFDTDSVKRAVTRKPNDAGLEVDVVVCAPQPDGITCLQGNV